MGVLGTKKVFGIHKCSMELPARTIKAASRETASLSSQFMPYSTTFTPSTSSEANGPGIIDVRLAPK